MPATVAVRATAIADLHDELTAERHESRDFAARIRVGADRIIAAAIADRGDVVVNEAGKIAYLADRRIRQTGGVL